MAEPKDEKIPVPDHFSDLEQETRELLHRAGARPHHLELTPDEQARTSRAAEAALGSMIAGGAPQTKTEVNQRPSRWTRRRLVTLTAVAAAFLVAVVGISTTLLWQDKSPVAVAQTPPLAHYEFSARQSGINSVAAIEGLAAAAASQPGPADAPVQLVVTEGWWLSSGEAQPSVLEAVRSERYLLPDGSVRVIDRRGQPLDVAGRVPDQALQVREAVVSDETFPGPDDGPDYPQRLSTDPEPLIGQLIPDPGEGPQPAACLGQALINLHNTYVLPADLIAGLWNVLAAADDVTYLGETTDRLGRPAVAIQTPGSSGDRISIIYADATTGAFLGSEEVLTVDSAELGLQAPAVLNFRAVVSTQRIAEDQVP